MVVDGGTRADEHLRLAAEGGTPPEDRRFRPDVQGMRAIAILFVVLSHADIPGFEGGYVGVDVFFVISGFVITGLLLRERASTGHTSIRSFYGRRARRIIPAASLVIVVTVIASYHWLGPLVGHQTAVDGQWAALFLANVHFANTGTNYLAAQAPPSPLLNYWSLGVEEQFYLIYPTLFLVIAWWARKRSFRTRLSVVLVIVIVASYGYSIAFTSSNPQGAYFSLLTRSWELALGGLIALHGPLLRRIPRAWAAIASWVGLAVILVASVTLTGASVYPGALVAIPTLGAGLVIAAGASEPTWGVERLLRLRPFQFLAAISFSLYLWHWPILEIAWQSRGVTSLPLWDNVLLLLFAGVLATLTYYFFENPLRQARFLARRRWASIVMGLCLVAATLTVTTHEQQWPTVELGNIASATTGSVCRSLSSNEVTKLRSSYYASGHQATVTSDRQDQTVLVIGDSTSCTLLPGLQAVGPSLGMQFRDGTVIGCGIVSGQLAPLYDANGYNIMAPTSKCQGEANRVESEAIERDHPGLIVWGSTEERSSVLNGDGNGSKQLVAGSPQWSSAMLHRVDQRVDQLLSTGARVVILLEPAAVHGGSQTQPNASDVAYQRLNALLREVAARHPHRVTTVNLASRVCPSGPPCPYVVDGMGSTVATATQSVRPDLLHYTSTSSLWVAKWLVPQIAGAAKGLSS